MSYFSALTSLLVATFSKRTNSSLNFWSIFSTDSISLIYDLGVVNFLSQVRVSEWSKLCYESEKRLISIYIHKVN